MDSFLHLSSFEFSQKINDIAFQKNIKPVVVEKQYFFSLLKTFINDFSPSIEIKDFSDPLTINGCTTNIKETFFDWVCMCQQLKNRFNKINLIFDFNTVNENKIKNIQATLYYTSAITSLQETLSLKLISSQDVSPGEGDEDDVDTSGGKAQVKIDESSIKNFKLDNLPKSISQILKKVSKSLIKNNPSSFFKYRHFRRMLKHALNIKNQKIVDELAKNQDLAKAASSQKPQQQKNNNHSNSENKNKKHNESSPRRDVSKNAFAAEKNLNNINNLNNKNLNNNETSPTKKPITLNDKSKHLDQSDNDHVSWNTKKIKGL